MLFFSHTLPQKVTQECVLANCFKYTQQTVGNVTLLRMPVRYLKMVFGHFCCCIHQVHPVQPAAHFLFLVYHFLASFILQNRQACCGNFRKCPECEGGGPVLVKPTGKAGNTQRSGFGGLGHGLAVKCLPHKHEDQSLDSQKPTYMPDGCGIPSISLASRDKRSPKQAG